jgi:D-galactonate transporter
MTLGAGTADELDRAYAKVSRRLLPLLLLGYIVAYLDRVNVGFAKLEMLADLRFSETVYGFGAGIFFIGYFLFEVPSNLILHRVGARLWIARIMISWGLISAAMMFARTPAAFYFLRFLLGAAEAGFFPGVIYYLTHWYPAERRGEITAKFMTGVAISSVIGSVLSGWILQSFEGVHGWAGWQWLFLLEALPAVVVGGCILLRLNDSAAQAAWLSEREKELLSADLVRSGSAAPAGSPADAFRDRRVWFACLIYFCIVMGLYGTSFWLPTIVADLGIRSPLRIGLLTAIPYAVATIGMVLAGRSADRSRERRWHVAVPAALAALGLAASVSTHDVATAIAALSLATLGILSAIPLFWSLPTAYLRGAAAAVGIAVINSFGNLAGFLGPYVIGWTKDHTGSTTAGMYIVAAFVLAAGILVIAGIPARAVSGR